VKVKFHHLSYDQCNVSKNKKASVEHLHLLRISDPALLELLLSHASTKRFIHERINATTAIVRQEHWIKLAQAAVALGVLIDGPQK
jgi:hypothetical protein